MTSPIMDPGVDPEKASLLQAGLDALNETNPPDLNAPVVLALIRHGCPKARQARSAGRAVSVAINLSERYEPDEFGHAIIYREGVCPKCSQVARSKVGRVVLVSARPPITGRVARD